MKKYITLIIIAIIIGFFLSYFVLTKYKNFNGVSVYKDADEYYFLQYGEYNTKEELENIAINLENYVYRKEDDKYYMYIGITRNKENISKIKNYYKNKNINLEEKVFYISGNKFKETIDNLDNILSVSTDDIVINEIINQGLNKYEEIVLNGS